MLDDIITTIKAQLYERATSPLLGSFLISWCVINYKFILIIFSSLPAPEKITYIGMNIFVSLHDYILKGVLYPLVAALALIIIYPYPAAAIYRISRNHQKQLKSIKQSIEDETPLTLEEARKLRSQFLIQRIQFDQDLEKNITEIKSLKSLIIELESSQVNLSKSAEEYTNLNGELTAALESEKANVVNLEKFLENALQPQLKESIDKKDLHDMIKQISKDSSPKGMSQLQREHARDHIKENFRKYIEDTRPFGDYKTIVDVVNDIIYTRTDVPDKPNIINWGKIDILNADTNIVRLIEKMRNHAKP